MTWVGGPTSPSSLCTEMQMGASLSPALGDPAHRNQSCECLRPTRTLGDMAKGQAEQYWSFHPAPTLVGKLSP